MRRSARVLLNAVLPAVAFLLAFASSIPAYDCVDYGAPWLRVLTGVGAPGNSMDPVVKGGLLFLPRYHGGFGVYSLADPLAPSLLATVALPNVEGLAVLDDVLVVANGVDGIVIVNTVDPSAPVILSALDTPGTASAVDVAGTYAYVADGSGGLQVVDLSDVAHPAIAGSLPPPGGYDVLDVAVSGSYVYLAEGIAGLVSVDVSSPETPLVADILPEASNAVSVALAGSHACVGRSSAFSVVRVTDPFELSLEGTVAAGAVISRVSVSGSHALAIRWEDGLVPGPGSLISFDVSDPAHPRLAGRLAGSGSWRDWAGSAVAGDRGYVADWNGGIVVFDATLLESPPLIGSVAPIGSSHGAVMVGDRVYFVDDGLTGGCGMVAPVFRVANFADPGAPAGVMEIELPWCCAMGHDGRPVAADSYVYVPDENQLDVVSIANPDYPVVTGSVEFSDYATSVAIVGTCALVACEEAGLQIVDVSDPSHPVIAASYDPGGEARDIVLAGGLGYFGNGSAGLEILDLADPLHPARLGGIDTPGSANGITIVGTLAFVADGAGLLVIDCADPYDPQLLSVTDTPGQAVRVAVDGGIAYVADGSRGVQVIDVRNTALPTPVGDIPALSRVSDVFMSNGLLYAVAGIEGIQVRAPQCLLATGVPAVTSETASPGTADGLALTCVPNPTRGVVQISLARGAAPGARVAVYDVSGRRVRDLAATIGPEGRLDCAWDGRDERGKAKASGVYLVRAAWEGGAAAGRVMLVR